MINSRAIITSTIHVANFPDGIKQISAEQTKSLSASGSINFPKFVTRLSLLARYPSKKSVALAIQKSASAIHLSASPVISNNKNAAFQNRKIKNARLPLFPNKMGRNKKAPGSKEPGAFVMRLSARRKNYISLIAA